MILKVFADSLKASARRETVVFDGLLRQVVVAVEVVTGEQQSQRLGFRLLFQPGNFLQLAHLLQPSAGGHLCSEIADGLPDLVNPEFFQRATGQYLRLPLGIFMPHNM